MPKVKKVIKSSVRTPRWSRVISADRKFPRRHSVRAADNFDELREKFEKVTMSGKES